MVTNGSFTFDRFFSVWFFRLVIFIFCIMITTLSSLQSNLNISWYILNILIFCICISDWFGYTLFLSTHLRLKPLSLFVLRFNNLFIFKTYLSHFTSWYDCPVEKSIWVSECLLVFLFVSLYLNCWYCNTILSYLLIIKIFRDSKEISLIFGSFKEANSIYFHGLIISYLITFGS